MSKESALAQLVASPVTPKAIPNGVLHPPSEIVEGVVSEPVAEPQKLDSTRFAHLAKKEAELVKQREAYKQERLKFEQEREPLVAAQKRLQEFEELKQKDALAAMKLAGFTDTDILNYFASLEDTSTPEEKAARAAQAEIKKFQDEQAKQKSEQEAQLNQKALDQFKSDIQKQLSSDLEKYEYCNFHGPLAEDLIYETVAAVLEESKELISVQEAADLVENYYEEQDKAMSTIKKRTPAEAVAHAKEQIKEVEQLRAEVSPGQPGRSQAKTLSSRATATSNAAIPNRKETPSEKRERLIQKLANLGK